MNLKSKSLSSLLRHLCGPLAHVAKSAPMYVDGRQRLLAFSPIPVIYLIKSLFTVFFAMIKL